MAVVKVLSDESMWLHCEVLINLKKVNETCEAAS